MIGIPQSLFLREEIDRTALLMNGAWQFSFHLRVAAFSSQPSPHPAISIPPR
jgi:hypothetical protein